MEIMSKTPRQAYFEMGMELSGIAHDMTEKGWDVDPAARERHRARLTKERDEAEAEFISLTGWEVTFRGSKNKPERVSPCRQSKKLHKLFYGDFEVGYKPEYYNRDTGELQVNANMLQDVADEHPDPLARKIALCLLAFRRAAKYLESFIENLPVHSDGRLHVPWNIYGARTMRWTAPILHQLPKDQVVILQDGTKKVTRLGLRDIMSAPEGWTIIEADKSQLELRLIALLTGDKPLMEAYARGANVHTENAKVLLGGDGKGIARDLAKTGVFNFCYGGDAHSGWKQMTPKFPGLKKKLVEHMEKNWWAGHPRIKEYHVEQLALARKQGFIDCPISGLRIEYHEGKVDRTKVYNTRVQHSGSDIMNPEVVRTVPKLVGGAWLAAMVHDANIVICPDSAVAENVEVLRREMHTVITYQGRTLEFPAEIKIGRSWGEMKELN